MSTPTTSIRLPPRLRGRLARHAERTKTPRSQVVVMALETYLDEAGADQLAAEARRQSLLASAAPGEKDWERAEGDAWPGR